MNQKINDDLKMYIKLQDKFSLSIIRMLKSAIVYESRAQTNHELSDEEIFNVIKRQIKTRKMSIEEYEKLNRPDMVSDLQREIDFLNKYFPEELSETEVIKIIDAVFDEIKPDNIKQMGIIMKMITEKTGGRADMTKVSAMVKMRLS